MGTAGRGSIRRHSVLSGILDLVWLTPYAALSRMFMEPAALFSALKGVISNRAHKSVKGKLQLVRFSTIFMNVARTKSSR